MRNGVLPQRTQQQQLDESIQRTRAMMQQIKNSQNPQAMLASMLQSNPNTAAIANMLHGNGGNLEQIAKSMAQAGGFDINEIIQQLGGL